MIVLVVRGVEVDIMVAIEVMLTNAEDAGGVIVIVTTTSTAEGVTTAQLPVDVTAYVDVEPGILVVTVVVLG